ncbi:MAG: c-type cytochrome [Acidobacteriia bacterium]|nr:c-type cytochrome [Terriglobia bacterium]
MTNLDIVTKREAREVSAVSRPGVSAHRNTFRNFGVCSLLAITVILPRLDAQRREPDPHDVEAGASRYNNICASCHGQDGDQVPGVDLGHNTFRRANSDQDLINIIRNGISGTGMPANKMSEDAAGAIVTYLHAMAKDASSNTSKGNAAHGEELYARSGCSACHRIGGKGARFGPDLSDIGRYRRSVQLARSIFDPSADIAPENRLVTVVMRDGSQIEGRLLNQDTFTVLLMDRNENLRSFDRSTLSAVTIEDKKSIMPSYKGKLTDQEVADIVTYLAQQKGTKLK